MTPAVRRPTDAHEGGQIAHVEILVASDRRIGAGAEIDGEESTHDEFCSLWRPGDCVTCQAAAAQRKR